MASCPSPHGAESVSGWSRNGEKAHSRYFSESVYKKLTGDNKELRIIPGASHTDLYDQMSLIPFEKLNTFFQENLK